MLRNIAIGSLFGGFATYAFSSSSTSVSSSSRFSFPAFSFSQQQQQNNSTDQDQDPLTDSKLEYSLYLVPTTPPPAALPRSSYHSKWGNYYHVTLCSFSHHQKSGKKKRHNGDLRKAMDEIHFALRAENRIPLSLNSRNNSAADFRVSITKKSNLVMVYLPEKSRSLNLIATVMKYSGLYNPREVSDMHVTLGDEEDIINAVSNPEDFGSIYEWLHYTDWHLIAVSRDEKGVVVGCEEKLLE